MESMNRRRFLKNSAVTAAGAIISSTVIKKSYAKNSPNDTINIGVAGIHSRGGAHYRSFAALPNVDVVALCDIDENLFERSLADVEKISGRRPKTYVDFRKMLEDKDIDAVSIATPDHWHALQTIWACQAGKDVYVEKPISQNIFEGRMAVKAARKYNRIVSPGMQSRSNPVKQEAIRLLHEGYIGDVYMAKGLCYKPRDSIGRKKDSPIPKGVNWDLFLGPAPYRPFNENRFHYNWHWFWDTGTTDMGNQGVHEMDLARWGMNKRMHPVKIHGNGSYYIFDSDQQTPNTQHSSFEYEDGKIIQFEVRGVYTNAEDGITIGNLYYGSEGWMNLGGTEFKTYFGRKNEPGKSMSSRDVKDDPMDLTGPAGDPHFADFIKCVRSRRWQDLNADILDGHLSASLCHLGNISYRTGRKLTFNPTAEKFINDPDANTFLSREYRPPFIVSEDI
ncbi:Gfo/Idh/MocA family oxidoreductase [candidate division KSB1 bacterium]